MTTARRSAGDTASDRTIGRNLLRAVRQSLLVATWAALLASPASHAVCVGNCDNGLSVTIDKVQRCVNIFLAVQDLSTCMACDRDGSLKVTIDEVQATVNSFLFNTTSCPMVYTATATAPVSAPSATPTPSNPPTGSPTRTPTLTPTVSPSPSTRTPTAASATATPEATCRTGSFDIAVDAAQLSDEFEVQQSFEVAAACGSGVNLSMAPTHLVTARLVNADHETSNGLVGATFTLVSDAPPHANTTNVSLGVVDAGMTTVQFRVTNGTYHAFVDTDCASGFLPRDLAPVVVNGADVDLGDVVLQSAPLFQVSGQVMNATGIANLTGVWLGSGGRSTCRHSVPVSAGSYALHLPAGAVSLTAVAGSANCGSRMYYSTARDLTADTVVNLPLATLPKITGTLVDMSAAPVASAAVVAFGTQTGVPSLPACTTNGSGQFAVSVLPNQTYQVLATPPSTVFPPIAPQLLASAAAVAQADVSLGTVALRAGCTLSGKLIVQSAIDPTLDLIAIGYRQIQGGVCLPYTAGVAHGITPQGNYFFTVLPAP